MEVLYPHCAGLDVHKDMVVACLRHTVDGTIKREVRTFKTTTAALLDLSEWLASEGCTDIVMEATGVYWKPVWHILGDGDFALTLANAAHVKAVPGRKTDVNDATWLADLLAHGLVRGSFVPDAQTQEMRGLLRPRKQLVRERTSHVQRLQKTLEDANIKLDSVISDVVGLSGRAMIAALIAGETDPRCTGLARPPPHQGAGGTASRSVARPGDEAPSLPLPPASPADRYPRRRHRRDRSGGRRQRRALSRRHHDPDHDPRHQRVERPDHHCRDRRRHEPLRHRW